MTARTSQRNFLLNHLRGTGRELTSVVAKNKYGVGNLRARITELRQEGFKVRTRKNAVNTTSYAISRRMVVQG
jgi:hypothetical protein